MVTIFSHMEHEDLLCAARVCRRWKKLSEEGALWKHLLSARWPTPFAARPGVVPNHEWKRLYRCELGIDSAAQKERAKRLQRRKMLNTLSTGLTDITISMVGDTAVGKSSLATHFVSGKFLMEHIPTSEDCHVRQCMWGGRNLVLRLCDTSGAMEDKVREGEWPWGFANVDLFLCCFDVTSLASLQHVKTKWAPLVRKLCLDAPIILCGLKGEYRYLIEGDQDDEHAFRSDWAIPEEECERVKEEIGAQSYIDFSPLLGDGLTLGTLFSCLSIVVQGVVDSEEEDQERANDEPSEPEDDNEIDILADLLARQGNRRATADSDEEYEGW